MKKRPLHFVLLVVFAIVMVLLCFFVFSLLFFAISFLIKNGLSERTLQILVDSIKAPSIAVSAYGRWLADFNASPLSFYLLLPLLAPLFFVIVTVYAFFKTIRMRVRNVYAKEEDLSQMGLSAKGAMVLGKLGSTFIKLGKAFSILVCGEKSIGKTSSIAISSVLASDMTNIIVMDEDSVIAKYTSGHRAEIGKVLNFDFDTSDNITEGKFLPRWNPLSFSNIPKKGQARDEYLACIARNLTSRKDDYWGTLLNVAMEGLLVCFVDKIEQAFANDYFLDKLMSKGKLSKEDEDILISYYAVMPKKLAIPAIANVTNGNIDVDNYLPIGSWDKIPEAWLGRELSLAFYHDTLVQMYFRYIRGQNDQDADGWKLVLDNLIREAKVFGYSKRAIQILEYLFYLSRRQRKVVFTLILEKMSVFKNSNVRERTSVSDITNRQLRGIKDTDGKIKPTTIYIKAKSEAAKFLARFMFDVLTDVNMSMEKNLNPIIAVLDDFENFDKLNSLSNLLTNGVEKNISLIMLAHDFEKLQEKYDVEGMEEIIGNTGHKLFMAKDNSALINDLLQMLPFATKAVQIPKLNDKDMLKLRTGLSDANYYARIAKGLQAEKPSAGIKKGDVLIMLEGYYYLPVRARAVFFLQDETLRARSKIEPVYNVEEFAIKRRNMQDVNPPSLEAALNEVGVKIKSQIEADEYIGREFEEIAEEIDKTADKDEVLVEDISSRWKTIEPLKNQPSSYSDWWMEEDAFEMVSREDINPFK